MGVVCVYVCGGWFCSIDAAEREGASSVPCYPGCAPPLGVHTLESHILNMSCLYWLSSNEYCKSEVMSLPKFGYKNDSGFHSLCPLLLSQLFQWEPGALL